MTTSLLVLCAAYAIGSLPFAYLLARQWAGVDLREVGSGNVGATNVTRTVGPLAGALALALDAIKGAGAVWLAQRAGVPESLVAVSGLAAILGHVFPVWLGFRGGKGVATAVGVFALLAPRALLLTVAAFVLIVSATRYVSLGSLASAVVLPLATAASGEPRATLLAAGVTAIIVLFRHRENLARLQAGTEPMLGARTTARNRDGTRTSR